MQLLVSCYPGKAPSHNRHKQLGEGRCHCYAAVVVGVSSVPLPLVQGYYLGGPPCCRCLLLHSAHIEQVCKGLHPRRTHPLEQLQRHLTQTCAPVGLEMASQHLLQFPWSDKLLLSHSWSHKLINRHILLVEQLPIEGSKLGSVHLSILVSTSLPPPEHAPELLGLVLHHVRQGSSKNLLSPLAHA